MLKTKNYIDRLHNAYFNPHLKGQSVLMYDSILRTMQLDDNANIVVICRKASSLRYHSRQLCTFLNNYSNRYGLKSKSVKFTFNVADNTVKSNTSSCQIKFELLDKMNRQTQGCKYSAIFFDNHCNNEIEFKPIIF